MDSQSFKLAQNLLFWKKTSIMAAILKIKMAANKLLYMWHLIIYRQCKIVNALYMFFVQDILEIVSLLGCC